MQTLKLRRTLAAFGVCVLLTAGAALGRQDVSEVLPGTPVEREMRSGESHSYRVTAAAGQYVRAVVDQRGIDVILKLHGPDGTQLAEVDGLQATSGSEAVSLVAESPATYQLMVSAVGSGESAGRYEMKIEELRAATPRDTSRVAAERIYAQGERLRRQGTEQSLRQAIEKYQAALPLWRDAGDEVGQARTFNELAEAHYALGEPQTALSNLTQALPLGRGADGRHISALVLNNLGAIYDDLGEKKKALDYYGQALSLLRELKDRRGEAATLSNVGFLYHSLGETATGLDHYLRALPLTRDVGDPAAQASALNNIGVAYYNLGELQNGLDHLDQSLKLSRAIGDRAGQALTLNVLGTVYDALGEPERALECFNQALPLRRAAGDRRGEGSTLNNLGAIHGALGETQKALDYYEQSLPLRRAVGDRRGEAATLNNFGNAYRQLGDWQKALGYYEQALKLKRAVGDRRGEAVSLHNLGLTYDAMSERQKALDCFQQALALVRLVGNRVGEAGTLFAVARALSDDGRLVEAREHLEAALDLIESLRTRVANQDLRVSYFAANRNFYELYIDVLMRLHRREPTRGHDAAALAVSERARARGLLETLAEARADIRRGIDSSLLERERHLRRQLNAKEDYRLRLLDSAKSAEQADAVAKELTTLLDEYKEVQAQIRARSPRYAALTQPVPFSLEQIQQQALDADTLLLEYALGRERSYLWAVTPSALHSYELPGRAEIERAARRFYDLLQTSHHRAGRRPAELAAAELSRLILGPLAGQLGKKRLLIVSEGALQYVPFAALPDPRSSEPGTQTTSVGSVVQNNPDAGQFLILNHEIVQLPSASVLAALRRELAGRRPAQRALAVLADPVFQTGDPRLGTQGAKVTKRSTPAGGAVHVEENDLVRSAREAGLAGFARLPFTRLEAEAIVAQAGVQASLKALDFAASRTTVARAGLEQYRIVHFATHGLVNSRHPELSGIVLSLVDEAGRPQDGFLRAHEVYNLNLGAELVVLSACRTALGKEIRGEGLQGLTRGFMYAGAARVVASLWDVRDEATAELMRRFYRGILQEKQTPAAALRAAQVSMLRERHRGAPYYWAGFVLQGEWR